MEGRTEPAATYRIGKATVRILAGKMTKEEMQRFLIKEAQRGSTEIEAYRNLMEIIGIEFPKENTED